MILGSRRIQQIDWKIQRTGWKIHHTGWKIQKSESKILIHLGIESCPPVLWSLCRPLR